MKEQPLIGQTLSLAETTRYRALAATANFLAIDRGDIVYCAKELSRHMATPSAVDWEKVVRLGSYSVKQTQGSVVVQISGNAVPTRNSDADWAGYKRTRRSTTGGYTVAGSHLIKMWCKTQAVVALSSAEAELYGLVGASAETMGLISMYKDLGTPMNGLVLGDVSAALAISRHRGPTRTGQIEVFGYQLFVDARESSQG